MAKSWLTPETIRELARTPLREIAEEDRCPHSTRPQTRDQCSQCQGAKPKRVKVQREPIKPRVLKSLRGVRSEPEPDDTN